MKTTLVVPCYNEARRLDGATFLLFAAESPRVRLLFVNDGSTDETQKILDGLVAQAPGQVGTLALYPNRGKAEAVRRGLQQALAEGAELVGYIDADLATPLSEVTRLCAPFADPRIGMAMASRVRHLGAHIERNPLRHYVGRVFATAASLILKLPVYDTQCGAKVFRACPLLEAVLAEPFVSRWVFDVELIGRLLKGRRGIAPLPAEGLVEVPVRRWVDVRGSKLGVGAMVRAGAELGRIAWRLHR